MNVSNTNPSEATEDFFLPIPGWLLQLNECNGVKLTMNEKALWSLINYRRQIHDDYYESVQSMATNWLGQPVRTVEKWVAKLQKAEMLEAWLPDGVKDRSQTRWKNIVPAPMAAGFAQNAHEHYPNLGNDLYPNLGNGLYPNLGNNKNDIKNNENIRNTYSEAQSDDMRNAHLVTDFIDLWRKVANSGCWPVVILSGNDNHPVEFFGSQIQTRLSSELEYSTPDQLINEMRTVTMELVDSQEWRIDDEHPKSIAWHFEILDQYRQDGFFSDCANTGSSDCTSQTSEADQPQAKAVNHCMVDLEVLSEPHIDNQADSFIDELPQIVDVQIEVLKPEPLNNTFTPTVEKPVSEKTLSENSNLTSMTEDKNLHAGETKQTVPVATETAPQEENTPKPLEVNSLSENTLKTTENGLNLPSNNNRLISSQGEQAARQRMRNCQKNSQIPDEIRARLEELLFTNTEKAKSRGNIDNADLTQ